MAISIPVAYPAFNDHGLWSLYVVTVDSRPKTRNGCPSSRKDSTGATEK
jgi:hypothetical protein